MRNRRASTLTAAAALGLLLAAATAGPARAGGCPTCAGGAVHGGHAGLPAGQYVAAPAYAAGYAPGAMAGPVPNGLTLDVFCGQGSGHCNQRYQFARRWAEKRYVKKTGAAPIPIDPYGARLAMSGPDYAYPEGGARVVTSTPAPTPAPAAGPDPAATPPAAPAQP
jgi:hypothetical protein